MFAQMNRTCCWPAPTTCLHSRKVISRLKRSATVPRMSATLAEVSVQKYARQPVGSSTSTTRITPPAGRQVARNVLYSLDRLLPVQLERVGGPAPPLAGPLGQVDHVRAVGRGRATPPRRLRRRASVRRAASLRSRLTTVIPRAIAGLRNSFLA